MRHEWKRKLCLASALPFPWGYRQRRSKISSWLLNFWELMPIFIQNYFPCWPCMSVSSLRVPWTKSRWTAKNKSSELTVHPSYLQWDSGKAPAPKGVFSWSPAKQHPLKGLFSGFHQEPHSIPCCHHRPSWKFIPHISGTSLPFTPVKNQGEPQSNRGSTLPREAAGVTTRTTLLGMAAPEVGVICCHQQLKNGESRPLSKMPSKSELNTGPFIF